MRAEGDSSQQFLKMFSDPEAVTRYLDGPRRFVPGFESLHQMAAILIAEHAPANAHLLVLGAGGGLELRAFAQAQPQWRFTGVDPAGPMLHLAEQVLGTDSSRATFVEGYIDDAPAGPFDAATCLLTLHFLPREERIRTLSEMRRRMLSGAPLVVVHSSFPQQEPARENWLRRYADFAVSSGADQADAEAARAAVAASLVLLDPEEDVRCLEQAGFSDVEQFFAAFTWRGWFARAS
jgi:tRNA (cmo5U34)-methyltransferase